MTSPVWPLTKTVSERSLKGLEEYFRIHPKRRPFDDQRRCYLNVLRGRGGHDVRQIASVARKTGWSRQDRGTVNLWRKPLSAAMPAGYTLRYAHLRKTPIHRDFLFLTQQAFKRGTRFMRELELMFASISPRTFEVVIYSRVGNPAAAGLVTFSGAQGYLFCGSVSPRQRGRGLWYALVAARQSISRKHGARFWTTVTVNPRIAAKCEVAYDLVTFYKDNATA